MADERRRSQRRWEVAVTLLLGLVVADGVAAAWSLIAGERWDWGLFRVVLIGAAVSAVGSSLGEALVRRGVFPSNPQAQRRSEEDDELAHAMRTGLLPADADRAAWRARLGRRLRDAVAVGVAITVLCIAAAVLTAAAAHLFNDDDRVLWALAVLVLLLPLLLVRPLRRAHRRARRLLARL